MLCLSNISLEQIAVASNNFVCDTRITWVVDCSLYHHLQRNYQVLSRSLMWLQSKGSSRSSVQLSWFCLPVDVQEMWVKKGSYVVVHSLGERVVFFSMCNLLVLHKLWEVLKFNDVDVYLSTLNDSLIGTTLPEKLSHCFCSLNNRNWSGCCWRVR